MEYLIVLTLTATTSIMYFTITPGKDLISSRCQRIDHGKNTVIIASLSFEIKLLGLEGLADIKRIISKWKKKTHKLSHPTCVVNSKITLKSITHKVAIIFHTVLSTPNFELKIYQSIEFLFLVAVAALLAENF